MVAGLQVILFSLVCFPKVFVIRAYFIHAYVYMYAHASNISLPPPWSMITPPRVFSFESVGIEFIILMEMLPLIWKVSLPLVGPGSLLTSSG